jgi:type IV pilus assembly protein PilX
MNKHSRSSCQGKRQQGVALIMAMVFLMILTIIGVTVMSTTSLQEKMAGNVQDKNVAFQAAETALTVAENAINASPPATGAFGTTPGYLQPAAAGATPVWNDGSLVDWTDTSKCNSAGGTLCVSTMDPGLVAEQPRYIVENLQTIATSSGNSLVQGFAPPPTNSGRITMYRITAYGVGRTTNAVAMVQSVYRK